MPENNLVLAAIGMVVALWSLAGGFAVWHGLSLRRQAGKAFRNSRRLTRLLETAPAVPVIVRSDGRLEASDRLSALMGITGPVRQLADLYSGDETGISADDMEQLQQYVRAVQKTGKPFRFPLSLTESDRKLLVVGNIADPQIFPQGAALLWFFDLTDNLRQLWEAKEMADEARAAFTALAALIEEAPMPVWHRRSDLTLNFVNRAYADAVGADSGDEVVAQGIELIESGGGASPRAFAAEAQEENRRVEHMVSATIAGERRQMRVYDIPLGQAGIAGLAVDMQELVDARGAFRRLSDAQRDLLNMMSAGVAQFDADHVLSFANLPFQRLFAIRDEWIAEKPEFARMLDRMRENTKLPEVRDFPQWRSEREGWFRSAEPNEENWLLPDGTHLRVLAQPVPNGGLLLIFEDRTEQAQLASARDTLLRVRTATFDNLSEAIGVFASDGSIRIWNRLFAEIWDISEDVLVNHPRLEELKPAMARHLVAPAQFNILIELLRMAALRREQRRSRVNFADGRIFQITTVPLPDGNALFTMLDMSDSVQIEQALRERAAALQEADAIKGRFLANMSYEFRTPLTSISGFADLLKAGIAGELNERALEYVDAIAVSAERLSQQINTVLDYSQGEAGALPISREPVDIGLLLQQVVDERMPDAEKQGVHLRIDLPETGELLSADARRLGQAFGHLIDNAIRYGNPGGSVFVTTRSGGDHVEVIVSDDGPGMGEREQLAIFDGFARTQSGEDGKAGGLGLPLARQLIESHGGELHLESKLGEGTTIIVKIPKNAG